jgi:hypothetical protein
MNFNRKNLLYIGLYTAVLLIIFSQPLFTGSTLFSLDSAPFYIKDYQKVLGDSFSGIWSSFGLGAPYQTFFHPHRLLAWLMPSTTYHDFTYLFDTALLAGAMVFFLRGRNISGWPALPAALGLSFSGYTFTLISAGHRVTFDMMPYAVFMLAFIDRGVRSGSLYQLAMAGLCAGIGMSSGSPDKMILFGLLGAAYGLVILIRERPADQVGKYFARLAGGAVLAGVIFATMSAGTYTYLFSKGEVVERRDKMRGDTPEKKWAYATNWSLPPSDALEFIAPCVYGVESMAPEQMGAKPIKGFVPYWGKLGMPMGWKAEFNRIKGLASNPNLTPEQKQQVNTALGQLAGQLNYRQHTVYLGVIPISFALFAILYFLGPASWSNRDEASKKAWRWFVWFWLIALILCILFSFGRYTPFYKIIYNLPVVNRIRAPVKFVHLVEVCLNVLFALGLATWVQLLIRRSKEATATEGKKLLLITGSTCLALAALMLLLLMVYGSPKGPLADYWNSIGRGAYAKAFAEQMTKSFGHACLLFLAAGFAFMIPWKSQKSWTGRVLPILVVVVLSLDLISVSKRYVRTKDLSSWNGPNPVADQINTYGLQRTSYRLGAPQKQDWHWFTFLHHRVALLEQPGNIRPPQEQIVFAQALQQNALRYWQLTNTGTVIAPPQLVAQLSPSPSFEVDRYFQEVNGRYVFTDTAKNTSALLKYKDALPKALLYYNWEPLNEADTLKRLAAPAWNPKQSVLVPSEIAPPGNGSTGSDPVEVTRYENNTVELKATAKADAVLLLNDAFHSSWLVSIDDQPAELFRANHVMRGIRIPAGEHTIRFEYQRPKATLNGFRISLAVFLGMMGVSLFQGIRGCRKSIAETGEAAS